MLQPTPFTSALRRPPYSGKRDMHGRLLSDQVHHFPVRLRNKENSKQPLAPPRKDFPSTGTPNSVLPTVQWTDCDADDWVDAEPLS